MEDWFSALGTRAVVSGTDEAWNAGVTLLKNNSIEAFGEGFEEVVAAMGQGGATMGDAISQGLTGMVGGMMLGGANAIPALIITPIQESAMERASDKALQGFVNTHNATYPDNPITVEIAKQAQTYQPTSTVSLLQTTLSGLTTQKLEHHAQQKALNYNVLAALWDDAPEAAKQRVVEPYYEHRELLREIAQAKSFNALGVGMFRYMAMHGKPHTVSNAIADLPLDVQDQLDDKIIDNLKSGKSLHGSFLAHLVDESVASLSAKGKVITQESVAEEIVRKLLENGAIEKQINEAAQESRGPEL